MHHLAGITNVPRTKSGQFSHDEKIKIVGEQGTQNILDAISKNAKLFFLLLMWFTKELEKLKQI